MTLRPSRIGLSPACANWLAVTTIEAIVPCAHGSGGVLVGQTALRCRWSTTSSPFPPMSTRPIALSAGSYRERGSAVMLGAAHLARQMLWQEMYWPDEFSLGRGFPRDTSILGLAAFRAPHRRGDQPCRPIPSVGASRRATIRDRRDTGLAATDAADCAAPGRRWGQFEAGDRCARRTASDTRVICGIHDSSANLYRYQAAGLSDLTLVSTGTWIVALSDGDERRLRRGATGPCLQRRCRRPPNPRNADDGRAGVLRGRLRHQRAGIIRDPRSAG